MAESKDYNSNFFFPKTAFAKENNRLITIIIVIWALAVFGFHGWMKAVEKAVPEESHVVYMAAVEALKADTASVQQKQDVAKVYLTLMGRYIQLRENADLQNAFTLLVKDLLPAGQAIDKKKTANIEAAINLKDGATDAILKTIVPFALTDAAAAKVDYDKMTGVMNKHLVHYRSYLTDTKFLGFPFHYFYSAVFSMVLFCGLCIFYCAVADKMMVRHGIESAE